MGDFIVLSIVIIICGAIIYDIRKKKKQGKGSCSCGCSGCALKGTCHSNK